VKLSYKQDGAEPDYAVTMDDDDGHQQIGHLRMIAAGRWEFRPLEKDAEAHKLPALTFDASDFDAAKAWMRTHIGSRREPKHHMSNDLMADHVAHLLRCANIVACKTDSVPGYIRGMAQAFALLLVEDVKKDKREEVIQHFIEQARDNAKDAQRSKDARAALADTLGELVENLMQDVGGDDEPAAASAPKPH
jgi:hypothetical protein